MRKKKSISIFTDLHYIRATDLGLRREKDCLPTCITMVLEYLKEMIISNGYDYHGKAPHNFSIDFWKDFWKKFLDKKPKHYVCGEDIQEFAYKDIPDALEELNLTDEIGWKHTTHQKDPIEKLGFIISNKNIPPIAIIDPNLLYNDLEGNGGHSIVLIKKEGNVFYYYDPTHPTSVNYATVPIELFTNAHKARHHAFMYMFPKQLYESISINTEQTILIKEGS